MIVCGVKDKMKMGYISLNKSLGYSLLFSSAVLASLTLAVGHVYADTGANSSNSQVTLVSGKDGVGTVVQNGKTATGVYTTNQRVSTIDNLDGLNKAFGDTQSLTTAKSIASKLLDEYKEQAKADIKQQNLSPSDTKTMNGVIDTVDNVISDKIQQADSVNDVKDAIRTGLVLMTSSSDKLSGTGNVDSMVSTVGGKDSNDTVVVDGDKSVDISKAGSKATDVVANADKSNGNSGQNSTNNSLSTGSSLSASHSSSIQTSSTDSTSTNGDVNSDKADYSTIDAFESAILSTKNLSDLSGKTVAVTANKVEQKNNRTTFDGGNGIEFWSDTWHGNLKNDDKVIVRVKNVKAGSATTGWNDYNVEFDQLKVVGHDDKNNNANSNASQASSTAGTSNLTSQSQSSQEPASQASSQQTPFVASESQNQPVDGNMSDPVNGQTTLPQTGNSEHQSVVKIVLGAVMVAMSLGFGLLSVLF